MLAVYAIGVITGLIVVGMLAISKSADLQQENWQLRQLLKTDDDPYGDNVLEPYSPTRRV